MKNFKFRLDGVLGLREFELKRAVARRVELEAERHRRLGVVAEAITRLEQGRAILDEESKTGVDARLLSMRADGVSAGAFEVVRAEIAVDELDPLLESARLEVQNARTRVRSLERLREKRQRLHQAESARVEQAGLDEMAITRLLAEGRRDLGGLRDADGARISDVSEGKWDR